MPLMHFLMLIAFVMMAAGLTLMLALWAHVPLVALGFAVLAGSVVMGVRKWL